MLKNLRTGDSPEKTDAENDPGVDVLFEQWKQAKKQSMKASSYGEFERMTALFIKILPEYNDNQMLTVSQLNENLIRTYKEIIKKIPKSVKTDGKTIKQLTELPGPRKSASTINNTLSVVGSFIHWMG